MIDSDGYFVGLAVQPGKTLALLGGDVRLEGGRLQALGGRVELGGLASPGSIGLNMNASQWSLSFPDGVGRADVYLTNLGSNTARVNVAASNAGSIAITARNIDISSSGTVLRGGIETTLGFLGATAGDIKLNATGALALANGGIANLVRTEAVGNAGNIDITTGSLDVKNGARLNASTSGQGDAGSVNINARDTVSFDGVGSRLPSSALSNVEVGAIGNAGGINITAGSIEVTNGARVESLTHAQGNANSVNINTREGVTFDGIGSYGWSSGAYSTVETGAEGTGGGINITAESLEVTNGAQLQSLTRGRGNAGSVTINARDTVSFDGVGSNGYFSGAYSTVETGSEGTGGGINITAESFEVTNGAQLQSLTRGRGHAGSVRINARDTVSFNGGYAYSTVEESAVGNAGNIDITARSLEVMNGARLTTSTFGQGDAGDMNIITRDTVSFYGISSNGLQSLAESSVEQEAVGNGGDINITAGSLFLTDSAYLTTQSNGSGNSGSINIQAEQLSLSSDSSLRGDVSPTGRGRGGNINLDVKGKILLTGASSFIDSGESTRITIGVLPGGIGSGGDLKIKAGSLVLTDGAIIKNSTQGQGSAGNIQVNADVVEISGSVPNTGLPSGLFTSTDTTGSAGDIFVDTRTFRVADGAALSARSKGDGQGGDIRVNATPDGRGTILTPGD